MIKILVVEDEYLSLMRLEEIITKNFSKDVLVTIASDGNEAIKKGLELCPDIAILDINIPFINGIDVAKNLRQHNPDCKIIFLTAYDEFNFAIEAIRIKATDYILKPVSDTDILHKLSQFIEINSPQDQHDLTAFKTTVTAYINSNYMNELSAEKLSHIVGMNKVYFSKLFKSEFSCNFIDYVCDFRMNKARELLKTTNYSVKDIATLTGYIDANYFIKVFKKNFSITPKEYKICASSTKKDC